MRKRERENELVSAGWCTLQMLATASLAKDLVRPKPGTRNSTQVSH